MTHRTAMLQIKHVISMYVIQNLIVYHKEYAHARMKRRQAYLTPSSQIDTNALCI